MRSVSSLLTLASALATTYGATLPFMDIKPIPAKSSNFLHGYFQPMLKLFNNGAHLTCSPYPAVDADGNVSSGWDVDIYRASDPSCSTSPGQIYARSGFAGPNNNYGIMYAWYFPKDSPGMSYVMQRNAGPHEWMYMVVWLYGVLDPRAYGIKYTAHGRWLDDSHWAIIDGHHPLIGKQEEQLWTDVNGPGQYQPLISWDDMPNPAKAALNTQSWDKYSHAEVWFNDNHFAHFLESAYMAPPEGAAAAATTSRPAPPADAPPAPAPPAAADK